MEQNFRCCTSNGAAPYKGYPEGLMNFHGRMVRIRFGVVNASSCCYPVSMESGSIVPGSLVVEAKMVSPGELHAALEGDDRFDIFRHTDNGGTDNGGTDSQCGPEQLMVRPPILGPAEGGTYRVVWGFRYRSFVAELAARRDSPMLPVLSVVGSVDTEEMVKLALRAEDRRGRYGWDEIDRVCTVVAAGTDAIGISDGIRDALDSRHDISDLLDRYRNLAPVLQDALNGESIDIRTAELIPDTLIPRWPRLETLTKDVSFSERRQILRFLADFVRAGVTSPDEIFEELAGRTGRDALQELRRLRYPTVTDLETRLTEFRNQFTRGRGITVDFPANYEGDYLGVSFRITSDRELTRRIGELQKMEGHVDKLVGLLLSDR